MFKWITDARKLPAAIAAKEEAEQRENEANRIAATAQQNLQKAMLKVYELEAKIRKQNEADLLMVSMQIVSRLSAGEKKDSPGIVSLLALQNQAMSNAYPYGMDSYSGFGALGNIGLWGAQIPLGGR